MNHTGMELGSLRREPHDLVALELAMVLMSVDSFALQGLDQARSFILDDEVSGCPFQGGIPDGHRAAGKPLARPQSKAARGLFGGPSNRPIQGVRGLARPSFLVLEKEFSDTHLKIPRFHCAENFVVSY
jgi:hypothetical protein